MSAGKRVYTTKKSLSSTPLGKHTLDKNSLAYIDGTIVRLELSNLFLDFVKDKKMVAFSVASALPNFRTYLKERGIDLNLEAVNSQRFARKVARFPDFIDCGGGDFYWLDIDRFTDEFFQKTATYLSNFFGYGSVNYFYLNNMKLCNSFSINSANVLFAVLKYLYGEQFRNEIDFIRNPVICSIGLSRDDFFRTLISEMQPINADAFFQYLESNFGISRSTLSWNYKTWFGQFLNANNEFEIEPAQISEEKAAAIKKIINGDEMISYRCFQKEVSLSFPHDAEDLTKTFVLLKLGYRLYANSVLFKSKYKTLEEAAIAQLDLLPVSLSKERLFHFAPKEVITDKFLCFQKDCLVLPFGDNQFLNVRKRVGWHQLLAFREQLVSSLDHNKIYTIDDLQDLVIYRRLLDLYPDIRQMINALGMIILSGILRSSPSVSCLEENGVFIFSTGLKVTIKQIVKSVVSSYVSIEKAELIQLLNNRFGLDADFPNSYFLEIGLYYNTITGKIYDSESSCNLELEDYLIKEDSKNDKMG